jgi:hypothetical protein
VKEIAHYGRRFEQIRLPKEQADRTALLLAIGEDGAFLLEAVSVAGENPTHWTEAEQMRQLPAVKFLRRMWIQQYWREVKEDGTVHLCVRGDDNQPPGAQRLHSPYDQEVRSSAKRERGWVGYKTQFSETSEEDEGHLITQVSITLAAESDMHALEKSIAHWNSMKPCNESARNRTHKLSGKSTPNPAELKGPSLKPSAAMNFVLLAISD